MGKKPSAKSVEPNVADLANGWLKSYGLDYKLEQEELNKPIDAALREYSSKSGGTGGNRPDAKLLLVGSDMRYYPVLIEYKGHEGRLIKSDANGQIDNRKADNTPNFANINTYAVNGAVHYANAILHYTDYTDIIAVGMTGWKDTNGELCHEIGVYYVSKNNLGMGQEVGSYMDLSFLKKENFEDFLTRIKTLQLTEDELEHRREKREQEISTALMKLNNDIYQNEKGLTQGDRVYLVVAAIMATLGVPGKVAPLEKSHLLSSAEKGNTDGDIMMRKIEAFLNERALPDNKKAFILRSLQNLITSSNINRIENGETQLKRIFSKIVDDLGIYYKIGLTTDFTGKLFNEMYNWFGFTQDALNDVVLTPPYVARLMVRLARTNKDSYVWDNATGSAGLLVAAMNEMLLDARETIQSPQELMKKESDIRGKQILGLEILPEIYMLAVLNMILMGDGSSHVLNQDSLKDFDGQIGFDDEKKPFPADVFLLNPPYSAEGNGMIFVASALSHMEKGYAAVIIQNSAGSGKAVKYTREILKMNTLLASIKMPTDLFLGKSNVQTNIYVFRVGEAHAKDDIVRFIDFTNDGYTRTNRKKARVNLRDTDHARQRYDELADLVRYGNKKLCLFSEKEYYEGSIDPENGADWNQSAPIDRTPKLADFKKAVGDYLAWEVSNLLKAAQPEDDSLGKSLPRSMN
jgi:Type I restriction-modification system methyltransferase subunit